MQQYSTVEVLPHKSVVSYYLLESNDANKILKSYKYFLKHNSLKLNKLAPKPKDSTKFINVFNSHNKLVCYDNHWIYDYWGTVSNPEVVVLLKSDSALLVGLKINQEHILNLSFSQQWSKLLTSYFKVRVKNLENVDPEIAPAFL